MRKFFLLVFFILFSSYCYSQEGEGLPLISVLDFEANDVSEAEAKLFTDYISGHIVDSGQFNVIDRGQRELILQELEFSMSGCTDENCQLEIGKILQAEKIIIGNLGKFGSRYILNIKLIDVETNLTLGNASEKYAGIDEMLDKSNALINTLLKITPEEPVTAEKTTPADTTAETAAVENNDKPAVLPAPKPAQKKSFPVLAATILAGGIGLSGFGGYMIYDAVSFNTNTLTPAWTAYDEAASGSDFDTLYNTYTTEQTEFNGKALTAALCTGGGLILTTISIILFASRTSDNEAIDSEVALIYPSVSYGNALSFSLSIRY